MASKARPDAMPKFQDILSKEEKEAVLDRKMEEMRKKNAMREKRYALIEADKKAAEKRGQSVTAIAPAAVAAEPLKQAKGVNSSKENKPANRYAVGRGKRLERMSKEKLQAAEYEESQRKQNVDPNAPPPDPSYHYLADNSRKGPLPARQSTDNASSNNNNNNRRQARASWPDRDKQYRQSGQTRSGDSAGHMSNRERRQYQEWKSERQKIDQNRVERAKLASGDWKREWDHDKQEIIDLPEPPVSRYSEPAKRPAGRIGSGRFDRGDRNADETRSAAVVSPPNQKGYSDTRGNNKGGYGKMESYDIRENMPVTRTIMRSRPKSQNFEDSPHFKGRPKSHNFDEKPVMMRQKSNEHQRLRPKSQNFEYSEQPKSKGRPKSQNFDERPRPRNRSKSQNYDDWPNDADASLDDSRTSNEETPLKVRFADAENAEQPLKVRFAPEEDSRPKKRQSLQEESSRKSRQGSRAGESAVRSVQERNESLLIKFDNQSTNMNFSLQHIDFDGFHGNGGYFSQSDHQASSAQRNKARTGKRTARRTSGSKSEANNWRQPAKSAAENAESDKASGSTLQEATNSPDANTKMAKTHIEKSSHVKSNKDAAPPGDDEDEDEVDERDAHNSSAESLERFIEEHTLRLDDDLPSLLSQPEPSLDWAEEMTRVYGDMTCKRIPVYGRPVSIEESPKSLAAGSAEESGEDETLESTVTDDDTLRSVGESLDTSSVADVEELDEEVEPKKQMKVECTDSDKVQESVVSANVAAEGGNDSTTGNSDEAKSNVDAQDDEGDRSSEIQPHTSDDVVDDVGKVDNAERSDNTQTVSNSENTENIKETAEATEEMNTDNKPSEISAVKEEEEKKEATEEATDLPTKDSVVSEELQDESQGNTDECANKEDKVPQSDTANTDELTAESNAETANVNVADSASDNTQDTSDAKPTDDNESHIDSSDVQSTTQTASEQKCEDGQVEKDSQVTETSSQQ